MTSKYLIDAAARASRFTEAQLIETLPVASI